MARPRTPAVVISAFVLALVAIGLYIGLATAFGDSSGSNDETSESVQAVLDHGSSMIGKRVSVQGEVSQVLNRSALTLGGDNPGTDDLLVLGRNVRSALPEPSDGAIVLVTGEVRRFSQRRAQDAFGTRFGRELFQPFEGKPAVRIGRIERAS